MLLDRAGIVDLYETLNKIKVALDEPQHKYRVAFMRDKVKPQAEKILEQRNAVSEHIPTAYNEAHAILINKCAQKDTNGRPIVMGNQFMIAEAMQETWVSEAASLKAAHKEAIDKYDAEVKKINTFLKEQEEIPDIGKIPVSWFNKNVNQDWLETLMPWLADDSVSTDAPAPASKEAKKKK